MLPLKIAWRFLRTSWVQTALIVAGIAVGIAVQVFIGSLITSLQGSLVDKTIGSSPHITLADPTEGQPVIYSDLMKRVLAGTKGVWAIVPVKFGNGMAMLGNTAWACARVAATAVCPSSEPKAMYCSGI